jgi:hypothetical protein
MLPDEGIELGAEPRWDPWHPTTAAELLADVGAPWAVAGGWALDLHRGEQTRPHHDLEIAVPAGCFEAIRSALAGYEFHVVGAGRAWPLASPRFGDLHQTWVWDQRVEAYRLDVFREPHDGQTWIFRRSPTIRMGYDQLIGRTREGIPFVVPEVVLLFKAKADRPQDRSDLMATLPRLETAQRRWLREALDVAQPRHPWLNLVG